MIIRPADRLGAVQEYYFSRKLKQLDMLRKQGRDVINLGIGSPDMMPEADVINILHRESLHESNHGYQSYIGIPELRKAFSDWYGAYFDVSLKPESEIIPLMGSKEGIMHISMAFLNKGDGVLVPDPGYPTYQSVAELVEADIIRYDLKEENGWMPDLALLEKQDLSRVKLMWVNYPNMPTGARASEAVFRALVAFGKKHEILICNDNPYSFVLNDEQLSILAVDGAKEVALELNSLSKSHNMAGWRIGVLAGREDYLQTVLKVKSNMDSGMFKPLQLAAVQALAKDRNWYRSVNEEYALRRQYVWEIFDMLDCDYDTNLVGMFVWAKIPNHQVGAEQYSDQILQESDVFITPGFIFGENGRRYLRISLCTKPHRLMEVKERINQLNKEI